jgi:hypothetical protein
MEGCETCVQYGGCVCWSDADELEFQREFDGADDSDEELDDEEEEESPFCHSCDGSGDCGECSGDGMVGTQYEDEPCEECDGTGVCKICNGDGLSG